MVFKPDVKPGHDICEFAFRPYWDFAAQVARTQMIPEPTDKDRSEDFRFSFPWVERHFRHLGVVFFGLNTARPVSPGKLPECRVSKSAVEEIIRLIRVDGDVIGDGGGVPPLVIGLTHHYPLQGKAGWAVDCAEHFDQLFLDVPAVGLWLHGHWHMRETTFHSKFSGRPLVVSSAPTLSVKEAHRPPDSARGFSMVELARKRGQVTGCEVVPAEWVGNTLVIRDGNERRHYVRNDKGYFDEK